MPLETSSKTLIPVPGHGTIKIVPRKGRRVQITAPQSLEILHKKGGQLASNRRKRLTGRQK